MADPHVLTALISRYRELAGKLRTCEVEAETLRLDLSHIDAVICLFRRDYDTTSILPRRPYRRASQFKKGVFIQTAIEVLQQTASPITTRELAEQTLERLGRVQPDKDTVEVLWQALNGSLMRRATEGSIIAHDCYPRKWTMNSAVGVVAYDSKLGDTQESLETTLRTLVGAMPDRA